MNFLLKIVEGPMKGAEIALVNGLRLKVGTDDACDIVLADGALAPVAFELDVGETSVSLVAGTETKTLVPFEIFRSGASAFALGPAEGAWQPLVDPAARSADEAPAPRPTEEKPAAPASEGDKGSGDKSSSAAAETPPPQEKKRRGCGCGCVGCLGALVLLLAVVFLAWYFWDRIAERYPQAEEYRAEAVERARQWFAADRRTPPAPLLEAPTLAEIASDHGLVLTEGTFESPHPCLAGNVRRRTERLAIRALALASDPSVRFDLTDDETLQRASDELLFVVTEGALKAVAATNRVVTLAGYAPTAAALEKAVRALNQDVKGIERLETSLVQVGGVPPAPSDGAKTVFAEPTSDTKAPRARGAKTDAARDYPIAGILTVPYPCVVLRDGLRLAEGATLGNATIEKIEAGKLVLRAGKTTFEWRP